jgi:hypothetical protein
MEIAKGLFICFGFVLLIFGISLPQTKTKVCDSCQTFLTKEDSTKIQREITHSIDSFVAVKKQQISKLEDSIKKIEKKIQ